MARDEAKPDATDESPAGGMEGPQDPNISTAGGPRPQADADKRVARTRVRAGTLADAVKDVIGASAGKDTVPILGHVLIEVRDGVLSLTATDLDLWITRSLASDDGGEPDSAEWKAGSRSFGLTVPVKVLSAVLGELDPDAMVTLLAPTADESRVVLKAGRSRFKLFSLDAAEFPLPPPTGSAAAFEIRASALADHFARVHYAISTEETRYYLNGVYMHSVDLDLRFAATDGHRLARLSVDAPDGAASWPEMIVGRHTVALLDKLLAGAAKADEGAQVAVNAVGLTAGSLVTFEMPAADGGEVTLIAKTVDGTFPDYNRVIPQDSTVKVTIDRSALGAALKRVGVLTMKKSRVVKLAFDQDPGSESGAGMLVITGSSVELGEASEELPCALEGEAITIGFDHLYLREALLAVASDQVVMAMTDPGGPCRIEAVSGSENGAEDGAEPALVQVVMPSRV